MSTNSLGIRVLDLAIARTRFVRPVEIERRPCGEATSSPAWAFSPHVNAAAFLLAASTVAFNAAYVASIAS